MPHLQKHFNSRPSARGDSSTGMSCRPAHNFNSRPSARGDFPPFCRPSLINYFNSRPSARGDPAFLVVRLLLRHHFNSRPSARGDMEAAELAKMSQYISIHAPPRGATVNARHVADGVVISIHAPPRGATIKLPFQKFQRGLFQFTPLREGRPALNYTAEPFQQISIHAPPRGATRPSFAFRPSAVYFNSRPSARGDRFRGGIPQRPSYFNSRPSARGDHPSAP